jgi:BT1 family
LKLSYLPPLMVYAAYGVSGLTGIVGTFFVKDYLDVSPAFLAGLLFWAGIPWALKMPVGHLVDLIWRRKAALVWLGASMIAASLLIMIGLISYMEEMRAVMSPVRWYVLAALLAPTGYMIQDAVADAMTVEAVPRADETGKPYDARTLKSMHTTMQTLGRVAVIGGLALVAAANIYIFAGTEGMPKERKAELYANVYTAALIIPVISVLGVVLHRFLKHEREAIEKTRPNWAVLGGSLVFVAITLTVGLGGLAYAQELVFAGSLGIILFLLWRLARELEPAARQVLVATALVLFVYRSMPLTGEGSTWWMIDVLKFNEGFLARLALVTYTLTLVGMFALRRFMAEHSIATIVVVLSVAGAILSTPIIGMYYGLHEWTAARTGGVVDARFIALINTALESPLGQIAMIPMLAWIANSAPAHLKATYFAVMASFANLALAASQLGTIYLNEVFVVKRGDYSELGVLMIVATLIGLAVPLVTVAGVRLLRLRTA